MNASGQFDYDVVFHGFNQAECAVINAPVTVLIGPYIGTVNESISFKCDGWNDDVGKIVAYNWEFGDGTVSNEQNPTHVYTKEGTYTARLTVTDDKG